MSMEDEGPYEVIVPDDDPADIEPDLKDAYVILDLRVRDGGAVAGWKEYMSRANWTEMSYTEKASALGDVVARLLNHMDSPERDQ